MSNDENRISDLIDGGHIAEKSAFITKTAVDYGVCENCSQRIGEECGITGREVYADTTCDEFSAK